MPCPDRIAIPSRRVDRREAAVQEEGGAPLDLEGGERTGAARIEVEGNGLASVLRSGEVHGDGGLGEVAEAVLRELECARHFLVAGAGPGGVVVARGDEAEVEAEGSALSVLATERHDVLDGALRPVVEGGLEAVRHWPASCHSATVRRGHDVVPAVVGRVDEELPRVAPRARRTRPGRFPRRGSAPR